MSFTLGELRRWMDAAGIQAGLRRADGSGEVSSAEALRCRAAVTDSRKVEDGFLFCAVKGDSGHGSDFLPSALAAGAVAALVEGHAPAVEGFSAPVLEVEDARAALAAAARGWLDQHGPRVIGITGSNGKTTTKDFLGAALGGELPASVARLCAFMHHPRFSSELEWSVLTNPSSVRVKIPSSESVSHAYEPSSATVATAVYYSGRFGQS